MFNIRVVTLTALLFVLIGSLNTSTATTKASDAQWRGPIVGPKAVIDKKISFISQDSQNGGITTLFRHFQNASRHLGWEVTYVDGKNDFKYIRKIIDLASASDAIVLAGVSASEVFSQTNNARKKGAVIVGWHANELPGPSGVLFTNITTVPQQVSQMAFDTMLENTQKEAGIVLFNDNRFSIANSKTSKLIELIIQCSKCELLSVENLDLGKAAELVPNTVISLNEEFGEKWTHNIAINDVYFDAMNVPLKYVKREDIINIAAGDGSFLAFSRMLGGQSQQLATIAEPIGVQGWQLADEINRAFAGEPPTQFIAQPILMSTDTINKLGNQDLDSNIPYQDKYKAIWFSNE